MGELYVCRKCPDEGFLAAESYDSAVEMICKGEDCEGNECIGPVLLKDSNTKCKVCGKY